MSIYLKHYKILNNEAKYFVMRKILTINIAVISENSSEELLTSYCLQNILKEYKIYSL